MKIDWKLFNEIETRLKAASLMKAQKDTLTQQEVEQFNSYLNTIHSWSFNLVSIAETARERFRSQHGK